MYEKFEIVGTFYYELVARPRDVEISRTSCRQTKFANNTTNQAYGTASQKICSPSSNKADISHPSKPLPSR